MMHRCPASPRVLAGIFTVLCAQPALAEAPAYAPLQIAVDTALTARWPGLSSDVHQAFDLREDIDQHAQVRLKWRDSAIHIEVALPDGRAAARSVPRSEDVVPTLESLLLLPPLSVEPSATPASAPTRVAPAVVFSRSAGVSDRDVSVRSPQQSPSRLRIELSGIAGARVGDGQTSLGVGALSFLDLSGWLVGFEGRADLYRPLASTEPVGVGPDNGNAGGGALELAVLAGRRFRFENLALDLTAGPAAAVQGTTTLETHSATTGATLKRSSSSTVPRLLLGARVSFNALGTVRTFVGIDGELGPRRAGFDLPGAPHLPVWSLGLALGATVGTK